MACHMLNKTLLHMYLLPKCVHEILKLLRGIIKGAAWSHSLEGTLIELGVRHLVPVLNLVK